MSDPDGIQGKTLGEGFAGIASEGNAQRAYRIAEHSSDPRLRG